MNKPLVRQGTVTDAGVGKKGLPKLDLGPAAPPGTAAAAAAAVTKKVCVYVYILARVRTCVCMRCQRPLVLPSPCDQDGMRVSMYVCVNTRALVCAAKGAPALPLLPRKQEVVCILVPTKQTIDPLV